MSEKREIPFARPWIDDEERDAALRVLSGHILTHGPECKSFEAEFAAFMGPGANCVSVSSCMAALHLSYLQLGIGAGHEVIVPAQTHVATVHAVEWVGARPVFVDCNLRTGNLDAQAIAAAITERTRAISVVHYVGIPCEMGPIVALAEKHGLKIIEDCAIAIGSRWEGRHVGLFGDAGCFSFYPVKHITTAEGGMFVSRHKELADKVARLRAFGVDRTHQERSLPGMYDVTSLGLNYRMSEVQAAIGRVQVARLPEILRRRRQNFEALRGLVRKVPGVTVLDAEAGQESSHYCLIAVLGERLAPRRDDLVRRLNAAGVGTSIYYPQPVNRMKYYREKYGYQPGQFENAATISDHAVALPVGPHLAAGDVEYVGRAFQSAVEEVTS